MFFRRQSGTVGDMILAAGRLNADKSELGFVMAYSADTTGISIPEVTRGTTIHLTALRGWPGADMKDRRKAPRAIPACFVGISQSQTRAVWDKKRMPRQLTKVTTFVDIMLTSALPCKE